MGKNSHSKRHGTSSGSAAVAAEETTFATSVPGSETMNTGGEGGYGSDCDGDGDGAAGEAASTEETAADTAVATEARPSESGFFTPAVDYAKGLLGQYQSQLAAEPFKTKCLTSCVISIVGEVVGSYLKQRKHHALLAANRHNRHMQALPAPALLDPKRIAMFGVYGLAITGPVFHWWYAALEKYVRSMNITGNANVLAKVALDRLVLTPPFLLLTLVYMQFFQTFNAAKTSAAVKNIYAGALYLNWKVWTVAQGVNFRYVPLEYRVLFGNMVALWWNIVLSLRN